MKLLTKIYGGIGAFFAVIATFVAVYFKGKSQARLEEKHKQLSEEEITDAIDKKIEFDNSKLSDDELDKRLREHTYSE